MVFPTAALLLAILIQTSLSYTLDPYQDDNLLYGDDYVDDTPDIDLQRRSTGTSYLRFGRAGNFLTGRNQDEEDFARPTRSGYTPSDQTDHFVRYGRGMQHIRFGRVPRDKSNYIRFGRSVNEKNTGSNEKRDKREIFGESKKDGSNFLRFGRLDPFHIPINYNRKPPVELNPQQEKNLMDALNKLIELIRKDPNKCELTRDN